MLENDRPKSSALKKKKTCRLDIMTFFLSAGKKRSLWMWWWVVRRLWVNVLSLVCIMCLLVHFFFGGGGGGGYCVWWRVEAERRQVWGRKPASKKKKKKNRYTAPLVHFQFPLLISFTSLQLPDARLAISVELVRLPRLPLYYRKEKEPLFFFFRWFTSAIEYICAIKYKYI